jgi:hypothetical protein
MLDQGVDLTQNELNQAFSYFDQNKDGFIDIDEFVIGMADEMNKRRLDLVRLAFDSLDTDGSGDVTVEEVAAIYDVSHHPDVISGKITPRQAIQNFMKHWEGNDSADGLLTLPEFQKYYKGISASIDDDDYFELMIRNAWRIAGGVGAAANSANMRVLVTNKDGSQSVQSINKEFGVRNLKDVGVLKSQLGLQGVDASNVERFGGMDSTDKAGVKVLVVNYYIYSMHIIFLVIYFTGKT